MRAWGRATKRKDKGNKTCTIWESFSEKYHYGIMEDNRLWEKLYKSKEKAICRREETYYGGKNIYNTKENTFCRKGRITETTIAQQIFYLSHNHSLDGTYNGCKRHTLLH